MGDEAGIICNETESCEKVLWSVVIDLCVSRKCEMKRNSTILLARQSPCWEKNNRNLEKTSVKLWIAGLAPWTTDLGPSPGNWQTLWLYLSVTELLNAKLEETPRQLSTIKPSMNIERKILQVLSWKRFNNHHTDYYKVNISCCTITMDKAGMLSGFEFP